MKLAQLLLWPKLFLVILWIAFGVILSLFFVNKQNHCKPPSKVSDFTIKYWMKGLLFLLGAKVELHGQATSQPVLFVSNHISWLDIICYMSVKPSRFISKAEVRKWPIAGWLAYRSGTLFLQRGKDADKIKQQMAETLNANNQVTLFPEGTTTNGEGIRKFFPRLFSAAVEQQLTVQAARIRYFSFDSTSQTYLPAYHLAYIDDDGLLENLIKVVKEPKIKVSIEYFECLSPPHQDRNSLAKKTYEQVTF